MSLRAKILAYLVLIHVILGGITVYALTGRPVLLLVAEALFVASAVIGYLLVRAFFVPLELIRTGAELMRDRDFSSHFRKVGQTEMDDLVEIYNRMVDRLRDERLKLEEQNLFLDRVLDVSPVGVLTLDHDGNVSQANPSAARLLGTAEGELLGRAPADLPEPFGAALDGLDDGQSTVLALQGPRRLKCTRVSFYDRGFARGLYLIQELTEELHASEKAAYGKLIRMMSHEVNNSVGAVGSLLESCRRYSPQLAEPDREDYDQAIEVAATRLSHLNAFMNGLADVVRVPLPDRRPCDLPRLMSDVALLLRPELEHRRIEIVWQAPESFPEIELDKNQIEQVLVNVLRNAMEAIGEAGTVTMSLSDAAKRPALAIHDSGPGVPAEVEAQLFTPFFSSKRHGQGVGLTLTREILAQHGFDYELRNAEGGGAEFRILF
jgi:nitrogen fixation/metabolism regulation signal transduction histidine kinase